MSIRAKLFLLVLTSTLIVWSLVAFKVYIETEREIAVLFDTHLSESAHAILKQAEHEQKEFSSRYEEFDDDSEDDNDDSLESGHELIAIQSRGDLFEEHLVFQIYNKRKELLFSSKQYLDQKFANDFSNGFKNISTDHGVFRKISQWNQNKSIYIVVAESIVKRQFLLKKTMKNILIPISFSIVPLWLILALIIHISIAPIRKVSDEISIRDPLDLNPIALKRIPREIDPLIKAINQLFTRTQRTIEKEKEFTKNASHELRTPLAAIKVQAQVAIKEDNINLKNRALQKMLLGIKDAHHLVEQLLTLSRLEAEHVSTNHNCNALDICEEVIQELAQFSVQKKNSLKFHVTGNNFNIGVDATLYKILVRNLLDNAIRFSDQDNSVQVLLRSEQDTIKFIVEDNGPGLTEEQINQFGDLFGRVGRPSGEGAGVGVSIVKRIVQLHQGTFLFKNRVPHGLIVEVSFPLK